jgi:hypothetical protein
MVMNRFLGSLIYGNEESIRRIIAFLFNTAHFSRRFLIIVAFGPISGEFKNLFASNRSDFPSEI